MVISRQLLLSIFRGTTYGIRTFRSSVQISSYESGIAAGNPGCFEGPRAIKDHLSKNPPGIDFLWRQPISGPPSQRSEKAGALNIVAGLLQRLANETYSSVIHGQRFLTLGGDHSCAAGTWSGVSAALRNQGDMGLIWIDAHMDSHTFHTTTSYNIHGMPLAALLGHGAPELVQLSHIKPKIKPENLALIGIRSYEPEEEKQMKKLGVNVFYMDDVVEMGFAPVLNQGIIHKLDEQFVKHQAIHLVSRNTSGFGVSIDLDGIDPEDTPGVGTPVPNGISAKDLMKGAEVIGRHRKFLGSEIVEFNPQEDKADKTLLVATQLIEKLYMY